MRLGRDDDVIEITFAEMLHEALGRERELLRLGEVTARSKGILERACVDTDAYGNAGLPRRLDDRIDLVHGADIARIDAQARCMLMTGSHRNLIIEVHVGNDGQWACLRDLAEARDRGAIGNGNADNLAAGLGQALDLREVALNVKPWPVRTINHGDIGHRLHADRRPSPNGNLADMYATRRITRRFEVHELPLQEEIDDVLSQQEDEQNE